MSSITGWNVRDYPFWRSKAADQGLNYWQPLLVSST
jgi:hypothetical protein